MVTFGLLIFFAVIVGFGAIVGLIRGLNKATIRLVTLVVAAALTFVIAGPVTNALAQNIIIEGQTLGEMMLEGLQQADGLAFVLDAAPLLREAILVVPAFALAILVFPVVFLLLKFLTWILFLFVQQPLRKLIFKDNCDKEEAATQPTGVRLGKRFAGLVVGIVTGALIFGMLTAPLLGMFTILPEKKVLDEALDLMAAQDILSEADVQAMKEIYAVTGSPLVNFYGKIGVSSAGRAYLNSVSKIEAGGYVTSLSDELGSLLATVQAAMKSGLVTGLLSPEDPAALFAFLADKDAVDALMQELFQSKFLRAAIPEMMALAMESVANTMQVPADKEAVYNNMMDAIAQAVKDADIDFAAIEAYEQNNRSRSGKGDQTGSDQDDYEANIQKLADLTSAISAILNKSISGNNRAFTDGVADQIVSQVKTQAAENGQASLVNFDAASVQQAIANIDVQNIDAENADKLLQQLADEEKFETDVATVETITEAIRQTVKNAVTDDTTAAQTANTLASVVADLSEAVSGAMGEDGEMDLSGLDFGKLADAITTLQNSNLKDVGSSVLDLVAAGNLGGNELVSNALGAMKEGYENGEDIGGAISSTGALISLGAAMGGGDAEGANQEAMVNSLTSLINNLNEFTIGLLPSIFSADTIASMGIPAEFADATFGVVETLLTELMNLKGADDYDSEVGAILSIYNLATSGMENFTEADVSKLVDYAKNSDAIFNTLVSVSQSNPFGIEIPDEAARQELVQAIEDNYANSGKTQRELDIFKAVATLLGLDEEVNLG